MGNPKVIFATAKSDDSNTANSYGLIRYGEIYNDKVPQSERYGTDESIPEAVRGEYQVDVFNVKRVITGVATEYANGVATGATHYNTVYSTRSTLGTFPLNGGGFEQMEFDTGAGSSSVEAQHSGTGVEHNYVAFANTGNGNNITYTVTGLVSPSGGAGTSHGPTTAYNSSEPFANIEFDVSHTSSALKAGAGGMGWNSTTNVTYGSAANNGQWYSNQSGLVYTAASPGDQNASPPISAVLENARFQPFYGAATGPSYSGTNLTEVRRGTQVSGTSSPYITQEVAGPLVGGNPGPTIGRKYWAFAQSGTGGTPVTMIPEIWTPGQNYSPSSVVGTAWKGAILFKVMPDSEHTMTANMVTTTAGVSSMTISAQGTSPGPTVSGPPIATHSRVTVTTSAAHKMTDNQNQVVIAGATNVTHVNGLWNVATIPSTTSFTYDVPYSTATSPTTITPNIDLTCVTFDGIDKTSAVVKSSGTIVAEIVHGGNAGNNKVILRGDVNLSGTHTIHSNSSSDSIATVNFSSRTYRSLFHEAGLELNETTGQVTSNGTFDGINDKGLKQLDGYFPKYKNGRDYALNQYKTDGTISQAPIKEGADSDNVTIHGGTGTLPSSVFFKSLIYANGFTANVLYATAFGNSSVKPSVAIEHNETVPGPDEGALGETYSLAYNDIAFPTPNTSSYWAMNRANNLRIIDPDDTSATPAILTYVSTSELFNTSVHFTIRAMKNTAHGPTGSSTKTISGWGTYENGEHNYVDGKVFIKVYNNTDADRDSIMTVYGDANNADSTSVDFNRNETAKKIDDVAVTDTEFLQNNYSNGNFTVINSA